MAFTTATISHTFLNDDGSDAVGEVTFTLTDEMTNGTETLGRDVRFTVYLSNGAFSQALTSNVDTGTIPTIPQPQWRVDIRLGINSDLVQTFFITVPSGGGSYDLFDLIPSEEQPS